MTRIPASNKQELAYYLQAGDRGPAEAFAELFCVQHSSESELDARQRLLKDSFPSTLSCMNQTAYSRFASAHSSRAHSHGKEQRSHLQSNSAASAATPEGWLHHETGVRYLRSNQPDLALDAFDEALKAARDRQTYYAILSNRACALIALNRLDEAIRDATEAARNMPTLPTPWVNLAEAKFRRGMYRESMADAARALALAPPTARGARGEALYWRSRCEQALGMTDQAQKSLRHSQELGYRPGSVTFEYPRE